MSILRRTLRGRASETSPREPTRGDRANRALVRRASDDARFARPGQKSAPGACFKARSGRLNLNSIGQI